MARSHGASKIRSTSTAKAHPGRMPLVGRHGPPSAPSVLSRRSARYTARTGLATHGGAPARSSA
eukprot:10383533-Lingulodinium_polyedra.AAC.1